MRKAWEATVSDFALTFEKTSLTKIKIIWAKEITSFFLMRLENNYEQDSLSKATLLYTKSSDL